MEENSLDLFKRLWLRSDKIDIPSYKGVINRPGLRYLQFSWARERSNGQSFRLGALNTYQKLNLSEFKGLPSFSSLVDDVLTVLPSSVNEFFGNVRVTPEINHLSQLHLVRPSSDFYCFKNTNLRLGKTGLSISRNGLVDPISMCLLKKHHLKQPAALKIKQGVFCSDRFGNGNITHFMYDVIGRYLSLRLHDPQKCSVLILLKGSISKYHLFILEVFNIPFMEIDQRTTVNCEELYVSCDITNDHSDGFAHPMKLLEPTLFSYMRKQLLQVVKDNKQCRKIYISRADAKLRMVKNEDDVMSVLEKRGFARIVLGELSPLEQFSAFFSAEEVIAPHGAGQASMITMHSGTKIKEFFHTSLGTDAFAIVAHRLKIEHSAKRIHPTSQKRIQATRIKLIDL
ncbi:glycosyltransferase family 61 protein [Agaribacter marinus]|uniref:Glycosyltransferase 61 catalytic domain-containing protein n=1 Tax=Agaribacter marinus TaxID=1431249 RepID=A0AA37SVT4_9ALTE|nr:glycosyltransferase family 61 protein [Agaribacter marinus]GLR70027.1 hypothetical protein GCM10007852_09350 [Agaribacter marinus]